MEARVRLQLAPAIAVLDADRLEHLDELARLGQLADADLVDRLHEGGGAAIHDGHFARIDLDVAVVDAQAAQGRQQMLHRADGDARFVAEDGAEREILHIADVGRDLGDDAAAFADQEAVAGVGFRGVQHHRDRCAAVNPRARQFDLAANRRLSRPDKSLRHGAMSLGPLVGTDHPIVVGISAPPVVDPLRSPVRLSLPVAHRLDSLGFMNQTICAVCIGDKSRFLSVCYRPAAHECWTTALLNACHVQKTPADQLVLHCHRRRFYCRNALATGPPGPLPACPPCSCQPTQETRLGLG